MPNRVQACYNYLKETPYCLKCLHRRSVQIKIVIYQPNELVFLKVAVLVESRPGLAYIVYWVGHACLTLML